MGPKLGQHFLKDETVRESIVAAARLSPGAKVLEIGPGKGFLTTALIDEKVDLTAIEMDERLAAGLSTLPMKLICGDFLRFDLASLGAGPFVVVSNLPYAVAAPILQKLLLWDRWTSAILMFQKEVAERVTAKPGCADYGLLTLSVINRADAEPIIDAPRMAFIPPPAVSSGVVRLTRREKPYVADEKKFFRVAKAAFEQRRKMAAGTISKSLQIPREKVLEAFAGAGIEPTARPENIPFPAFVKLAEALS